MSGTLLIVDDEQDLKELISDLLIDAGYSCLSAGSADEATSIACQHIASGGRIELIISDLNMPGGSGIELLKGLRGKGIVTPFLFLSGDIIDAEINSLKNLGVVGYQLKPFRSVDFLNRLKGILGTAL